MGVVRTILIVAFVIISILLVLLVMVQNDQSNGMGGVFGGNSAAFGAHSGSVLTKTTGVLVALFFVLVFVLALLNKAPSKPASFEATAAEYAGDASDASSGSWYKVEDEAAVVEEVEAVEAAAEEVVEAVESAAE